MIASSFLFAAGIFGSAGMLLWAAAALVPLLLHLWNRSRHVEATWAAMEFLLAAVRQQSRRLRIEQLLLLILRMAIPIIFALALADPIWQWLPALGSSIGSRPAHHHLLMVDGSYSMGYELGGRSRMEHARQLARDIVDGSQQGDGFTLLLMADPPQIIVGSAAFDPQDMNAEIAELRPRDTGADLEATLELARQTISQVRDEHPRLQKHRIYVLSDLGANTWQTATTSGVRERIGELESLAEFVTIDVGSDDASNAGISSVTREASMPIVARDINWRVTVSNFGGSPLGDAAIEMLVDGRLADRQPVVWSGDNQVTANFSYRFDTSGQHRVEFHLTDDALPIDNRWHEVVTVRNTLQVLCVSGRTDAARNVALAIAPNSADTTVQTRIVGDYRLPDLNLADFDVVFFCNTARFTANTANQLREFLRLGRGMVMFLGDQVQPDNYNQLLTIGPASLLPAKIGPLAPADSYRFDPQDYDHPVISPFRGQERAGLLTTPVWRYFRLEVPAGSPARIALRFSNGDPVIVEHRVESGRVILVATAASAQSVSRDAGRLSPWSAWSTWPSFPPLVQEMLALAANTGDESSNLLVGDLLGSTLRTSSLTQYVTVSLGETNDVTLQRVPVVVDGGVATWSYGPTHHTGFYVASTDESDQDQQSYFAVNLADFAESKLERVRLEDLPSQLQRKSAALTSGEDIDVASTSAPLFRLLLGLLLLVLCIESFVAWFLGNART